MDSLERVRIALDGGEPDRVPCALGFSRVDGTRLGSPDSYRDEDWVDVQFVHFPPSPEDEALRRMARPYPPDVRLGTFGQTTNYTRWDYHPEVPERSNPLARARSLDDLRRFPFPDLSAPYHVQGLAQQVRDLHARGLAVGGNLPHLGGELFEAAWRLRGLQNLLLDMVERPAWAGFLLDRLLELAVRNAQTLARAGVDLLALSDDVGMPTTMIVSPETWQTFLKPRLATIIRAARAIRPDLRVLYHSDGYYEPIVADLIEIGINAINPVQPDHMNAARIRRQFGPRLALWGTVGHQTTFSYGTSEAIRCEVKQRIATLGRVGLILSPAYDIDEPDIPWPNVAAFLQAVRDYG